MALKRKQSDWVSPLYLDDQVECSHEPLKRLKLNKLEVYVQESSYTAAPPLGGAAAYGCPHLGERDQATERVRRARRGRHGRYFARVP